MVEKSDFNENPVVSLELDLDFGLQVCQHYQILDDLILNTIAQFQKRKEAYEKIIADAKKKKLPIRKKLQKASPPTYKIKFSFYILNRKLRRKKRHSNKRKKVENAPAGYT